MLAEFSNGIKRYQIAVGSADDHVFQIANGNPFLFRVTHHHPHFVITTLHALCLRAIKRIAHLAADVVEGEAHDFGLRFDGETQLILVADGFVANIDQPRVSAQTGFEFTGSGSELGRVFTDQLEGDGVAADTETGAEAQ